LPFHYAGYGTFDQVTAIATLNTMLFIIGKTLQEPLKNVDEAVSSRQKSAKKRSLYVINEHFEPIFNAKMATQVVFQRFLQRGHHPHPVYRQDSWQS